MAEYFTKDGDEFKKVEETLLTQSEIDTNIIPKRLERERAKFADYDTLKEKAGKVDTITQDYEDKLKIEGTVKTELEEKLKKANLETSKVKIVHEYKLSSELSEFVNGDNEDEMRQRAEKLSKSTGKGGSLNIEKQGKPDEDKSDSRELASKLFRNKSSD